MRVGNPPFDFANKARIKQQFMETDIIETTARKHFVNKKGNVPISGIQVSSLSSFLTYQKAFHTIHNNSCTHSLFFSFDLPCLQLLH